MTKKMTHPDGTPLKHGDAITEGPNKGYTYYEKSDGSAFLAGPEITVKGLAAAASHVHKDGERPATLEELNLILAEERRRNPKADPLADYFTQSSSGDNEKTGPHKYPDTGVIHRTYDRIKKAGFEPKT